MKWVETFPPKERMVANQKNVATAGKAEDRVGGGEEGRHWKEC